MPNYEFRCLDCRRRFDLFFSYSDYGKIPVICPHCQSSRVDRRIGRVRFARSEESRLENLADPSQLEGLENDPRSLGRMMRKLGSEAGEDLPPEFNEVVGRLEAGQSPEDIEKEIPDLGGAGMDDGGMGMGGLGADGGMDDL
jgi:putative FmdB family regulatory protein